jgi:hypothetical protein
MKSFRITVLVPIALEGAFAFSTNRSYQGSFTINHSNQSFLYFKNSCNGQCDSSTRAPSIAASSIPKNDKYFTYRYSPTSRLSPLAVARYGPQLPPPSNQPQGTHDSKSENNNYNGIQHVKQQQEQLDRKNFRELVEQILHATSKDKPEHIPRILANHMEFVLSLLLPQQGAQMSKMINQLLEETKQPVNKQQDDQRQDVDDNNSQEGQFDQKILQAVDIILTFAEEFVQQAQGMDQHNKQLLGKIIKAMKWTDQEENPKLTVGSMMSREETLDQVMEQERDHFTPGFLRHIEGECERISSAPSMTRESARLLELLRMIQTRVLEELGKEMGEAALVLGQLMGYNDDNEKNNEELLGVLDAGLTVRGSCFAMEMRKLTQEALDGFQRIPGGDVDPDLVERVKLIDSRLQEFLDEEEHNDEFQ